MFQYTLRDILNQKVHMSEKQQNSKDVIQIVESHNTINDYD
jgi:hypothetical protein